MTSAPIFTIITYPFLNLGENREENLSTIKDSPQAVSWLSPAQAHQRRPKDIEPSTEKKKKATDSLEKVNLTFSPDERIRKRKDFNQIFKKGKVYTRGNIQLFILPRKDKGQRVGFVLSSRVKSAVRRNRLRRLLREACRLNKNKLRGGFDLLFRVTKPIPGANLSRMEKECLALAEEAGLLKGGDVSRETF